MKEIKLTQGKVVLVDDSDYEWLSQKNWHAVKKDHSFYARTHGRDEAGRKIKIYMHRLIMDAPKDMQVDHADADGLNNQRSNLRVCTKTQNSQNQRKQFRPTSSKYKGVIWFKRTGQWRAEICLNKKRSSLGYFSNEEDAAIAYDRAAMKLFGEFARTNLQKERGRV